MFPSAVDHHGVQYDLQHLNERFGEFKWQCQDGQVVNFKVNVHCSDHCFSEELIGEAPSGAYCFLDRGRRVRIFNPDRHAWSKELPDIVDQLFRKPTTQVRLTAEQNWCIFQLYMKHPLPTGEKYYCFFRVRYLDAKTVEHESHHIHLHVESAYSRSNPPLTPRGNERSMFGRLVERLMLSKNNGQPKLP